VEEIMKRLYLAVVLSFFVIGFSTISWAEGNLPLQGSIGVGARFNGVFPKSTSFLGQKLDYDNAVGGELNVTYRFLKYLALEVGAGYTETDVKNKTLSVDWATIEAIPLYATLQLRWVSAKPEELKWFVPYALIGGGYYILEIEEKSQLRNFWYSLGVGVDLDIDDAFFFHLGGGFDIFVTKHIALNFEARYAWAKTDVDETQQVGMTVRTLGDTINLNAAFVGAGFKIYF
jgi:outer membrane protein W